LAKHYFIRLIVLIILFILINLVIHMIFQVPGSIIAALHHNIPLQFKYLPAVEHSGQSVAGLFGSVCLVIFYYDLRIRKEGFDLKMLATMNGSGRRNHLCEL